MKLIGLDIGTTGCKASLFESDGRLLARASREYRVDIPNPGWAEQDAGRVWLLAQECLREVYQKAGPSEPVAAIGLSCQGEAVTPVDGAGRPLRPTILGMDTRTDAENAWLREKVGAEALFQKTGMPLHTINTLPKLLWIQSHEPDIWRQATHFLLYEDFLIQKMTGQPVTSACLASRTQMFDLAAGGWSSELLDLIGLDERRLAPVAPSGTPAGEMLPDLARAIGFPNRPMIATGGHDQACGALGVGLVRPGLCMVSTGTAEVVEVALDQPALTPPLERGNISVYAHVIPGMYLAMTLNHSGGLVLRWFRDEFCGEAVQRAEAEGVDPYDAIFGQLSPDPSPLLLLPHFSGSGTPQLDTESKGAVLGLTFASTREDVAKAILEGLTFELRNNLEVLREGGVRIEELRAIGGGARSEVWLQLKADVTGVMVRPPRITEAASWGAAVLGGVAAGCFHSAAGAVEQSLQFDRPRKPDPRLQTLYEARYQLYLRIYPALKDILHQLTSDERQFAL